MKALLGGLLLWGCASGPQPPAALSQTRTGACATIVATNDEHGRMLPETPTFAQGRPVGGVAALATYYRRIRKSTVGCPVFLLSAGDVMQGTPISNLAAGEPMIAAFNLLGYDAAAMGNHEFDWGVETLRRRMNQAEFPFLAANIYLEGTSQHPDWVAPYTILERGGVRIGVIGATTTSTPITTRPRNVTGLEFRPIFQALDRYIPEVRAKGVDFVVVVMHAGGLCDKEAVCDGEAIRELERTVEPFDYAVTGHTHSRIDTRVKGAPVVQAFSYTTAFSVGRLERRSRSDVHTDPPVIRTAWADSVPPDSALAALVSRAQAVVAEEVNEPIATLAQLLRKQGAEYGLGRLIADAQRAATGSQVAIMNNGGIRTELPAGPVTYGDLFKLQPFQNELVLLHLQGSVLLAALEHAVAGDHPDVHVSGLRVQYDPTAPAGARMISANLTDGSPILSDGAYVVTVNDFMADGGGGFSMLKDAREKTSTGIIDLEALTDYLRSLPQPVEAPEDPRWIQRRS